MQHKLERQLDEEANSDAMAIAGNFPGLSKAGGRSLSNLESITEDEIVDSGDAGDSQLQVVVDLKSVDVNSMDVRNVTSGRDSGNRSGRCGDAPEKSVASRRHVT